MIDIDIQSQAGIPKHIIIIKEEVVMKLRGIEEVMRGVVVERVWGGKDVITILVYEDSEK